MLLLYLVIHQIVTPLTFMVSKKYTYMCECTWNTSKFFFSIQYVFVNYSLQICILCTFAFLNKLSFLVWYNFYHSERQQTIQFCSLNCSFHFIWLFVCLPQSSPWYPLEPHLLLYTCLSLHQLKHKGPSQLDESCMCMYVYIYIYIFFFFLTLLPLLRNLS